MEALGPTSRHDDWMALLAELELRNPGDVVDLGLSALVRAGASSSLTRFRPTISMFLLCLEAPGLALAPPVFFGVTSGPMEYLVWWGRPWSAERATIMRQADDPREAVAFADQILRDWPWRSVRGPLHEPGEHAPPRE